MKIKNTTIGLEARVDGIQKPSADEAQRVFRNPLDDSATRILLGHIGHDVRNPLNVMMLMAGLVDKAPKVQESIGYNLDVIAAYQKAILRSVSNTLGSYESLAARNVTFKTISAKGVEEMLIENAASISKDDRRILVDVHNLTDFKTDRRKLQLALLTTMDNSWWKIPSGKEGQIKVTATDWDTEKQGELPELVYQNPITPLRGKFAYFKIEDNGSGLVKGTTLYKDLVNGEDPITAKHFGFWLVRYISEVLRSHFYARIHTKDSDTGGEVALFHPAKIEAMYDRAALNPLRRWVQDQIATRAQLYGRIAQAYGSIAHNAHKGSTK